MLKTLPSEEYAERRRRLMAQLPEGSVAIVPGARMMPRNRDVEYPFRQDSDFYYLTGFDEPEAVLLLLPGRKEGETLIFCQDRDPEMEIWNGYRAGPEGVVARFGADEAYPVDEIDQRLPPLLDGRRRICFGVGADAAFDARVRDWLNAIRARARQGAKAPTELVLLDQWLHEMRLFKSDNEIELMRAAGDISARAHVRAMQQCRPGMTEYQLEAEISHHFAIHGCRQPAYASIVGGGANACVLHYTENRDELRAGDLVLIDAGCELDYYAGDITRTFPVDGRFSPEQKALYELVLKTQLACIDLIKPGVLWNEVHDLSVRLLTEGLVELGLLEGEPEELIERGAYRDFYMHRLGHWLGMDVHDVGDYRVDGEWRPLKPGMVMTVEPGLYVSPQNEAVEARWRGIGIRIEDDVLVTDAGCEVLTAGVPKTVAEIETLMADARRA
ncbi:Xaa-Pro aminopeptidase [Marinobacterium nitratireducens]|uniref:Xaa-Pro aminopeptidase n=1 Tax=Marinobacterium nitratireducens TaxID=518897 RepID=A0A918DXT4_9GAMM|nr:Xaa-Pro aminopeptidase [Marinobacterium nitratireducens]GGO87738.1 Xaa-Pro aminopeptidase [Marinobacterium nitratireducens]